MDKKDRFNKLIRYIVWAFDVSPQSTYKTIAAKAGIGHSNLTTASGGNPRYLTDSLINKVNMAYGEPFRREWLLFGTGDMFSGGYQATMEDPATVITSQQETIQKLTESLSALTSLLKKQI